MPFVLDRTIPITPLENISLPRSIYEFQDKKQIEIRQQIGDLLAYGLPYELKDSDDSVQVYVPHDATHLRGLFGKVVKESGFTHWQKRDGKASIVKSAFAVMPDVLRFAVDRPGYKMLRDPETFKITEENRTKLAQLFFPEQEPRIVRKNISFEYNKFSPVLCSLVIRTPYEFHAEIKINDMIYPLYAIESCEAEFCHAVDFVELTKKIQAGELAQ